MAQAEKILQIMPIACNTEEVKFKRKPLDWIETEHARCREETMANVKDRVRRRTTPKSRTIDSDRLSLLLLLC